LEDTDTDSALLLTLGVELNVDVRGRAFHMAACTLALCVETDCRLVLDGAVEGAVAPQAGLAVGALKLLLAQEGTSTAAVAMSTSSVLW
tara:strand:- start:241 stop:507 length:267 start_codon:yes stop_codon:yes gene_type:complete